MEEYEFNINDKRGSASKDILVEIRQNKKKYSEIKNRLCNETNERLGVDFKTEYFLPADFNSDVLTESVFKTRCLQKHFIPFSNEQIEKFITMSKRAVGNHFNANFKGKNIFGSFLLGEENGKNIIYALTIVKGTQHNENLRDFSIKLDMLVAGKEWFSLARFDSIGAGHPNYFSGEKVAHSLNLVEFAKTPHLHINSEETQVLFSTRSNCEYTPAKEIVELRELRNSGDKSYFKKCLESFLNISNIKSKINKNLLDCSEYNKENSLFDSQDVLSMDTIKNISKSNKEKGLGE